MNQIRWIPYIASIVFFLMLSVVAIIVGSHYGIGSIVLPDGSGSIDWLKTLVIFVSATWCVWGRRFFLKHK